MGELSFRLLSLLPEKQFNTIQISRRVNVWRGSGAIFMHVPKAAGVSVSRALYGRPLGHYPATEVRRVVPNDFSRLYTFAVVRHPVKRLQSAYSFAKYGGSGEMAVASWRKYQTAEFATFESFVHLWLADRDVDRLDGIFRSQQFYVCDEGGIIVDEIVKLEHLRRDLNRVEARIGRQLDIGHQNRSLSAVGAEPSASALSIIRRKYKADFEMFDYMV